MMCPFLALQLSLSQPNSHSIHPHPGLLALLDRTAGLNKSRERSFKRAGASGYIYGAHRKEDNERVCISHVLASSEIRILS